MRSGRVFGISMLLFLIGNWQIQAQIQGEATYLIKYELEFKLDSTDRDRVFKEVHRLYTGTSASYYVNEGKIFRDSIIADTNAKYQRMTGSVGGMTSVTSTMMSSSETMASVFKDLTKSEVWVQSQVAGTPLHYLEPNSPLTWEFTEDTKQIGEYAALKATTSFGGRDYEAWFTLEVPILDGPYIFSGLPGLILELYDTKMDYHFNLASITALKENYAFDLKATEGKLITKEEFIKSYKKHRENPGANLSGVLPANYEFQIDGKSMTTNDLLRSLKEVSDKNNNLIEIWR